MPQSEYWPFMKSKPIQPDDVEFGQTLLLQKQLGDMEGEVKEIQMELAAMRRGRHDSCPRKEAGERDMDGDPVPKDVKLSDNITHRINEEKYSKEESEVYSHSHSKHPDQIPADSANVCSSKEIEPATSCIADGPSTAAAPRRVKEIQVSRLREELVRAKTSAEEERRQRLKYEAKLKDMEVKINDICCAGKVSDTKETRRVSEEVAALKSQVRDMKEETEELRMTVDEKTEEMQEYRLKYMQAQQLVEELKRQLDVMEFDNKQASEQIQVELQKMKMQFQEKLLELAPLPDLLKGAQIQLQEAKQLQKLAEDSGHQMANELHQIKEKLVLAINNFNHEKNEKSKLLEDFNAQKTEINDKQKDIEELMIEIDDYKCKVLRLEEKLSQQEARYSEKAKEYCQLAKDLEELREESGRSLNRVKDRAESSRHYLQAQIAGLERQMIACRAQCRSYQKERDEIRQRMQIQLHSLKENFELVETRLKGLQGQVAMLKHCYSVTLPADVEENFERQYT